MNFRHLSGCGTIETVEAECRDKQRNIVSLQHMVYPIIRKGYQSVCT